MEQEMPDYETIRAAVVSEKWALEKCLLVTVTKSTALQW